MSDAKNFRRYTPVHSQLLVDANVLIQYVDSNHKSHRFVLPAVRTLLSKGVALRYPDFILREFREYFRKLHLKAFLLSYVSNKTLGPSVDALIRNLANFSQIRDRDFKDIRDELERTNPGHGYVLWFQLCELALKGKLSQIEQMIHAMQISVVQLGDVSIFPSTSQSTWPTPATEASYMLRYGLGSVDSALLDWFDRGQALDGLFTNDHDILLAQRDGDAVPGKVVFTTLHGY